MQTYNYILYPGHFFKIISELEFNYGFLFPRCTNEFILHHQPSLLIELLLLRSPASVANAEAQKLYWHFGASFHPHSSQREHPVSQVGRHSFS